MPSSADVRLLPFRAEDALSAWHLFEPHLAVIGRISRGRYSPETARALVGSGDWHAWGIARGQTMLGAAFTVLVEYATNVRELIVMWLGGKGSADWLHLTVEMERAAREMGCRIMTWYGRPGWKRLQERRGYRVTRLVMEKEI